MASKRSKLKRLKESTEGQTVFTKNGLAEKPRVRSVFEEFTGEVSCAYCLYTGPIGRFARTTAKGKVSENMFTCPDCGQSMRKDTLMMDAGPEQYAEWLYTQIVAFRAYERISWDKLKKRLKENGIADAFWKRWRECKEQYHATKPPSIEEQQEAWIREQQEEEEESKHWGPKHWKPKQKEDKMIDV